MSPFTILPVLLPLIGGILMLMARPAGIQTQRIFKSDFNGLADRRGAGQFTTG